MTTESPFATTRLPDLPPTVRLQVKARGWAAWWGYAWPAALIGLGVALFLGGLVWLLAPATTTALPLAAPTAVATPPLEVPETKAAAAQVVAPIAPELPPAPAPRAIAYWSPRGEAFGEVELVDVVIVEQYRGWARFRTPHLAQDLWAPRETLAGIGVDAQLVAAPEIAPTALPPAPPVYVAVSAPAPPAPPVELQPAAPTVLSEAGNLIVEDSPERYVVQQVLAPDVTPVPTAYAPMGGGGGSWDD